jgi:hypothetical protein
MEAPRNGWRGTPGKAREGRYPKRREGRYLKRMEGRYLKRMEGSHGKRMDTHPPETDGGKGNPIEGTPIEGTPLKVIQKSLVFPTNLSMALAEGKRAEWLQYRKSDNGLSKELATLSAPMNLPCRRCDFLLYINKVQKV